MKNKYKIWLFATILAGAISVTLLQCAKDSSNFGGNTQSFRSVGYSPPNFYPSSVSEAGFATAMYQSVTPNAYGYNITSETLNTFFANTNAYHVGVFYTDSGMVLVPIKSNWHTLTSNPALIVTGLYVTISPMEAKNLINSCAQKNGVLLKRDVINNCLKNHSALSICYGLTPNKMIYVAGSSADVSEFNSGFLSVFSENVVKADSSGLCPSNCDFY